MTADTATPPTPPTPPVGAGSPDPDLMGPIFDLIVEALTHGAAHPKALITDVCGALDANRSTVEDVLWRMGGFGLVHRAWGPQARYELTPLGRWWLESGRPTESERSQG